MLIPQRYDSIFRYKMELFQMRNEELLGELKKPLPSVYITAVRAELDVRRMEEYHEAKGGG